MDYKKTGNPEATRIVLSRNVVVGFLIVILGNTFLLWFVIFMLYKQVNQNTESMTEIQVRGFVPLDQAVTKADLDEFREEITRMEKVQQGFEEHLEFDDKKIERPRPK